MSSTAKYQSTWHLADWATVKALGSELRRCPACGKLTYKPYVDGQGNILDPKVGRCNREINCGYHVKPKDWMAQNGIQATPATVAPQKQKALLTLPLSWVRAKMANNANNPLLLWLLSLPWSSEQLTRLEAAILSYGVGTDKLGRTIWWQIDSQNRLHSGKMMRYDANGHRVKTGKGNFGWVHSAARAAGLINDDCEFVSCLFGEHLIKHYPQAQVCVVESEKSALICSAFWPMSEKVWVATGGLSSLHGAQLSTIATQHSVWLYPDHDGYSKWLDICREIGHPKVKVADLVERLYQEDVDPPNADIADVLLRVGTSTNTNSNESIINKNIYLKELISCLNLQIENSK